MKLWMKIAAVCTLALLVVVTACSAVLLVQAKDSLLALTMEQVKDGQRSLQNSFSSMADYYIDADAGAAAEYSMAIYCFSQFADETGVLLCGAETMVSQIDVRPEVLLPLDGVQLREDQRVYTGVWEGRPVMIAGGKCNIRNLDYSLYVVRDVSDVYGQISGMTWRFVLISVVGIAVGAAVIILMVRRASRPLAQLSMAAREIAAGDYAKRTEAHTHDEVGQLAADFNRMADAVETRIEQLEETARRQRLFIGGVTHEFKTPMTSLMLHSDTLLNSRMSEEERNRSLRHIYEQCAWLERLTQKLLKLVTLGEDITAVMQRVRPLLDAAAESMAETLAQRGTPLTVECDGGVLPMDFDLMRSLLVNLIDNASKASKPGQAIRLSAKGNVIEVRDEGCGMTPEILGCVTEPFFMADRARSRKSGGMGLGLALAERIAEAHGAQMEIMSEPGRGTAVGLIFSVR